MANVIKHKRGSGSDPSASNLVVGELAIRTDTGKLFTKMDSGSIAEIAGGGSDIAINTLSSSSATGGGSATFNGSAYRFTLSSPPSVSAQQLLVSVNGVIQKPVAGTGQPSEGFSVSGNDIIFGDAPATGADFFILTFRSLGVSEPADNSVTSAKIVDGAIVNADINASAAIAGSKISPTFSANVVSNGGTNNQVVLESSNGCIEISRAAGGAFIDFKNVASEDFDARIQENNGGFDLTGNVNIANGLDVTGNITGTGNLAIDTNTLFVNASNDRVGINNSNPSEVLHVVQSGTNAAEFRLENDEGYLLIRSDNNLATYGAENHIFHNRANNDEYLRITSDGFVGINESQPNAGLTVGVLGDYSTNDGNTYYMPEGKWSTSWNSINSIVNNTDYWVGFTGGYTQSSSTVNIALAPNRGNVNNQAGMYIAGEATGTSTSDFTIGKIIGGSATGRGTSGNVRATKSELFRIKAGGTVGINDNSPNAALVVKGTTSSPHTALRVNSQSESTKFIAQTVQDSDVRVGTDSNHPLDLYSNSNRRLRITGGGQVLIGGVTSPNTFNGVGGVSNLVVAGSTADTDITDNSGASLTISNTDGTANNTAGLHFAREDTDGVPHYSGASVVAQFKETMNTGQYPKADLAFLTSSANNNAPTEKMRLLSSGGLTFNGDSSSDNALDDYEEGTFTPTSNATLTSAHGSYTKIGRQVTVHIRVKFASQSSSTAVVIGSLPFSANMPTDLSNGAVPSGFGYISGSVINGGVQIHMQRNAAQMNFYVFSSAVAISTFSNRELRYGLVYHT